MHAAAAGAAPGLIQRQRLSGTGQPALNLKLVGCGKFFVDGVAQLGQIRAGNAGLQVQAPEVQQIRDRTGYRYVHAAAAGAAPGLIQRQLLSGTAQPALDLELVGRGKFFIDGVAKLGQILTRADEFQVEAA